VFSRGVCPVNALIFKGSPGKWTGCEFCADAGGRLRRGLAGSLAGRRERHGAPPPRRPDSAAREIGSIGAAGSGVSIAGRFSGGAKYIVKMALVGCTKQNRCARCMRILQVNVAGA
jgi:hypothetical protein